jgi:chaperone modulatory protein CbpM
MEDNVIKVYHGSIADEESTYTLIELCNTCRVKPEFVIEMINEGILDPEGKRKSVWRFSHEAVENTRKVIRFQRDLNINLSGAALALELLARIEELEAMLERNR